ncbi:cell envelope integrity protein TolA [Marinobacterium weihaiense]|uniref:Cell envelope integrity protein TolA n=1 Tax=Marinobacterium weihaiense TaxID=2851016 RepID=A0ABS6M7D6_9GAMM|nr:cell envelope integrity protein TolA [Marinobacterium weihaiense]MBV0932204.1 cell envelope integrity protein TolA [Marinobacterium weihaiense]
METRSYIIPFILALGVHAGALVLLGTHWVDQEATPQRMTPRHIEAQMIDLTALAQRQAEKERAAREQARAEEQARAAERRRMQQAEDKRRQALERRKAKAEAERKAKAEAERERRQALARQREAEQKRKAEEAAKRKAAAEEQKRKAQEQARREAAEAKRKAEAAARAEAERQRQQARADAELERALARERQAREAAARRASESVVGDMQSYITSMLQDSWRIPSTARNGMEAVVAIHFLPSGEVDQAYIHTSSGNAAFDNSAVQAVYRVKVFPRFSQVDPVLFERRLRKLLVKFRPEGLRW